MTLTELIALDPDARGYGSLDNAQVAADLNERRRVVGRREVTNAQLRNVMDRIGLLSAILQNPTLPSVQQFQAAQDLDAKFAAGALNLDSPTVGAILDAFVTDGLLSAEGRAEILAIGDVYASLAEIHLPTLEGLGTLTVVEPWHVGLARENP